MMIRDLSLIELNTLTEHPLKNEVTIRGNEVSVIVEDHRGRRCTISAAMDDGVVVDLHYDMDVVHVDAIDEFRDYLAELEEIHAHISNTLDPMPDNDNKRYL